MNIQNTAQVKYNLDDLKYIQNIVNIYKDDLEGLNFAITAEEISLDNCEKDSEWFYLYTINCLMTAKMIIETYR